MARGTTGVDEMLAAAGPKNQAAKQAIAGRLMDDFKAAIRTTADDPLGNKVLSAAGADRWWQANRPVAEKVMTSDQVKALDTLVADFAVGARRPMSVAGSNTAQNLASGNMLQAILRFPSVANTTGARFFGKALDWLYTIPEEQLRADLARAMLDPRVASALMVKASEGNAKILEPLLRRAMVPMTVVGAQSANRRSAESGASSSQ
jgi:hypothetical protein